MSITSSERLRCLYWHEEMDRPAVIIRGGAAWHGLALGTGYRHWMVLTLGGRPRAGLRVAIQVQQSGNAFKLGVLDTADTFTELCPFRLGELTK